MGTCPRQVHDIEGLLQNHEVYKHQWLLAQQNEYEHEGHPPETEHRSVIPAGLLVCLDLQVHGLILLLEGLLVEAAVVLTQPEQSEEREAHSGEEDDAVEQCLAHLFELGEICTYEEEEEGLVGESHATLNEIPDPSIIEQFFVQPFK